MLAFSDLHMKPETFKICKQILIQIGKDAAELKEDIAFLGDWFHLKNILPVQFYAEIRLIMEGWFEDYPELNVTILPGNHDQYTVSGRNALEIFDFHPQITVINEPTWNKYGLWIPYRKRKEDILEALKLKRPIGADPVAFMHHGLIGAKMNNLVKNDGGNDESRCEGIKISELPRKFDKVYLGHYHGHQTVKKKCVYIGSPYETTWAEEKQKKGYMIIHGLESEFKEWNIGPRHIRVKWNGKGSPKAPKGYRPDYDIIEIVTELAQEEAHKNKVAEKLEKAGFSKDVIVDFKKPQRNEIRLALDPKESRLDQINKFLLALDIEGYDKEELVNTLKETVGEI